MAGVTIDPTSASTASPDALLDALRYSASHDLKSPLLSLSLSADLIVQSLPPNDDRIRVALDGLRHGSKDIERMLDALTAISRARRRELRPGNASLRGTLAGHAVISDLEQLDRLVPGVDPGVLTDLLTGLFGERPGELRISSVPQGVMLDAPFPAGGAACEGSALEALLNSLTTHAGTTVETLAALEVLLRRQGGDLLVERGRVHVRLPLVSA